MSTRSEGRFPFDKLKINQSFILDIGGAGRMVTVDLYPGIRRAVIVDGLRRREAPKRFGVRRNTITKLYLA